MLVLANACWGVSFPLMKAVGQLTERLVPEAGTWFVAASMIGPRFALAALVLVMVAVWGRGWSGITSREWRQGLWLGGFSAGGMVLQADGLQYTAASTSAFLTQLYAVLIPLWVAWRTRRNPGGLIWGCVALVLVGVAVLGRFDWRALHLGRGETETLVASLFFMGQILTLERRDFAGNRVLPITLVMFLFQAVVFGGLGLAAAPSMAALVVPLTMPVWWGITLVLTVVCTLGAYGLMNTWQPRVTATEAGLIYCTEPIFGAVFAAFLPAWLSGLAGVAYANETLTRHLLIGGGLITVANLLLQLRAPTSPSTPPPAPAASATSTGAL